MLNTRVPVFAGPKIIEFADPVRLRRILQARNAKAVRRRRDRAIVQVNIFAVGDDTAWNPEHPRGNPRRYSHDHENPDNPRGTWKLRYLPDEDRPVYLLAVTDCLAA